MLSSRLYTVVISDFTLYAYCLIFCSWFLFFFFFSSRRRHTRSDRDWSSDVCSSDLTPSRLQRALARALSFLVSVVGLVVLAPVLGLIGLLIKLDSRGPVFFVQEREIGRASCRERV